MSLTQLANAFGEICKLAGEEHKRREEMREVCASEVLAQLREDILSKVECETSRATRRKLWDMLIENTGAHFLDSGGHYGRAWQRHQLVDFEATPEVSLSWEYGFSFTRSAYHWLAQNLEYNETLTNSLLALSRSERYADEGWGECIEAWLASKVPDAAGLYGDGEPWRDNTYNHENVLDQTLLFTFFTIPSSTEHATKFQMEHWGSAFLILQIHGGADVRGGYTAPVVFEITGEEELLWNMNDWNVYVDPETITDPGYDPDQNALPFGDGTEPVYLVPRWSGCEGVETDDHSSYGETDWQTRRQLMAEWKSLDDYETSDDPENRGKGVIYVDVEGNGYCPITGGRLHASGC